MQLQGRKGSNKGLECCYTVRKVSSKGLECSYRVGKGSNKGLESECSCRVEMGSSKGARMKLQDKEGKQQRPRMQLQCRKREAAKA